MRVSVSWASARDGADDVLGATAYDGVAIDADVAAASVGFEEDEKDEKDETSRVTEPQTKENGFDLDDVPVPGAPQASFDALLEASLASASDPRAATPASPSLAPREDSTKATMTAKTPETSSAAPRPFLKRGARQQRVAGDAEAKRAASAAAPSNSAARPAADGARPRAPASFGHGVAETRGRAPSAPKSAHKQKSAREEDELAEFEALERELLRSSNDAKKVPVRDAAAADAAAAARNAARKAGSLTSNASKRTGTHRASVEKAKLAAAMRSVRLDSDDDFDSDADEGGDDDVSFRAGAPARKDASSEAPRDRPGEGAPRRRSALASPTPPAFDDGDSWDDDAFGGVADALGGQNQSPTPKSTERAFESRPGEGAPELIKSLFYGASKAGASGAPPRGARAARAEPAAEGRRAADGVPSARAAAEAAAAKEAAAAAKDAAEAVRRERDRLEKEKSAFAKEKRVALKERQTQEARIADARDLLESQKHELEQRAERVRRDRQRLERDTRRAAENGAATKRERTELESVKEALAKATEEAKTRDAKHRAAADRLRRQVADLRDEVDELKGEKRRLEQQLLRRGAGEAERGKRRGAGLNAHSASKRDHAREAREARERRDRRDREEMEQLAREQRERRAREEARERELANARDEEDASDEEDAESREDAESLESEPFENRDAILENTIDRDDREIGVSAVEAAAAHRVPSVRDAPPRVGPPPAADGAGAGLGAFESRRHEDGRVERVSIETGRRVVTFANGTVKDVTPSAEGAISTVYFTNGDVKRAHPGGRVEYFYKEVDTWHTTHPEGVEVYHFPSGQTEAHGADGRKEILFPDGLLRRVFPDGREEDEPKSA